jgi:hypothetical protein
MAYNIPFYVEKVLGVKKSLQSIKIEIRKYEEDEAYKEYCEGIIDAAVSALGLIARD